MRSIETMDECKITHNLPILPMPPIRPIVSPCNMAFFIGKAPRLLTIFVSGLDKLKKIKKTANHYGTYA